MTHKQWFNNVLHLHPVHEEGARILDKYMSPAPSAGKHVRARHDLFGFCFSLVEKVARFLQTNHSLK